MRVATSKAACLVLVKIRAFAGWSRASRPSSRLNLRSRATWYSSCEISSTVTRSGVMLISAGLRM